MPCGRGRSRTRWRAYRYCNAILFRSSIPWLIASASRKAAARWSAGPHSPCGARLCALHAQRTPSGPACLGFAAEPQQPRLRGRDRRGEGRASVSAAPCATRAIVSAASVGAGVRTGACELVATRVVHGCALDAVRATQHAACQGAWRMAANRVRPERKLVEAARAAEAVEDGEVRPEVVPSSKAKTPVAQAAGQRESPPLQPGRPIATAGDGGLGAVQRAHAHHKRGARRRRWAVGAKPTGNVCTHSRCYRVRWA